MRPDDYKSLNTWAGRSLENYLKMHPKAKGAKTLTEARLKAFGPKPKRLHFDKCSRGCVCGK